MRYFYFIILTLVSFSLYSQVGIGTTKPKAALDLNGNMIVRSMDEVTNFTEDISLVVRDRSSAGDYELKEISQKNLFNSASIFSAYKSGRNSLLNLSLLNTWSPVNLDGANTRIGNPSLLKKGVYTAPQSGIYRIDFEIQLQSGVDLSILGGKKMAILKNGSLWESKYFDAVKLELSFVNVAQLSVTSTTIDTLVALEKGDEVTFVLSNSLVGVSVITSSTLSLQAYKIGQL